MLKLICIFVAVLATFSTAQRTNRRVATTTTTTTSAPDPDYVDGPDVVSTTVAPTTRTRLTTVARRVQAKVNVRPVSQTVKAPVVTAGGFAAASSSSRRTPVRGSVLVGPLSPQSQDPWAALDSLRGKQALNSDEIMEVMLAANPGVDFPILSEIPEPVGFQCANQKQPGFYADPDFKCQVFRRCDPNGVLYSFLCPNTTIFNQITLTCDHWYNVDCSRSVGFYDFSNARLYHENWPLLGSISAN